MTLQAINIKTEFYAYCKACCDVLGKPQKIDRKNLPRHLRSPTHRKRVVQWEAKNGIARKDLRTPLKAETPEPVFDQHSGPSADFHLTGAAPDLSTCAAAGLHEPTAIPNPETECAHLTNGDDLFVQSQEHTHSQPLLEPENDSQSSDSWSDSTSDSDPESFRDPGYVRVLLAYARETRGEDIPTFKQLKKAQAALKHRLGNPKTRHVSPNGHIYYMNRIIQGIAQDFANPYLRKHMQFYPHLDNKRMSEVWHGAKMLTGVPDHLLTPMIRYNSKIFYVNELVKCGDGWFLPQRWIMKGEKCKPYAVGYVVGNTSPSNKTRIKDHSRDWGVKDALGQLTIDRLVEMGQKMRLAAKGGVRACESDVVMTLQKELDMARQKGCVNAFLDMDSLGFNVHEDTPTEILHTVLLGVVKYFWGQTVFVLSKSHQMRLLETRLASINISGLNIDSVLAKYMCQYTGSLIGKHFRILSQVMPFACHDLVQPDLLEVWLLLGRLTSLLWYTEIEDVDLYTTELQEVIDDFLTATARCSPSIIIQKPKFHFLVHLPMYIKRFGPAILFSTERYESFHGVFHAGSLFSNHHAPSRDIAEYFVGLDRLKHICSGGYWQEGTSWVRAGCQVRSFISENKNFAALIGFPAMDKKSPFSSATLSQSHSSQASARHWKDFSADKSTFCFEAPQPSNNAVAYFHIPSITSQSGDTVGVGCNILFGANQFGQLQALFGCTNLNGGSKYYAAVRPYNVAPTKHPIFDLPMLSSS
ncbi:hypothetical protein FRC06_005316 [Ceratobasidium sp. 370]|nr:hypothetical protein FRC06_005316 [Ceratobasidium sp. 370]